MNKEELMQKIKDAKTMDEINELRSQMEALEVETRKAELEKKISDGGSISKAEERSLMRESDLNKEKEERNFVKVEKKGNDNMPEEKRSLKDVLASEEYRSAWAKTLMNRSDLDEKETRALGDAVTTTATTYVQSAEGTQGINNGGYSFQLVFV